MTTTLREFNLVGATGQPRLEMFNGREHIVIPVIALMEGVIHPVNAPTAEFVSAKRLAAAASTWNGRALVVNHPSRNGVMISANDPLVMQQQGFGTIFQSRMNGTKLSMEAWIDPARLEALSQHQLLADIRAGKPIEVSVGAAVMTTNTAGSYNGKPYKAEWEEVMGDHLAFLPGGRGACSVDMGCGANRSLCAHTLTDEGIQVIASDEGKPSMNRRTLRERVKALITKVKALEDTPAQAASEEAAELIGYKSMLTLLEQAQTLLGEAYSTTEDLISDETENPTESPEDEAAEEEVEAARLESVQMLGYAISTLVQQAVSLTYKLMAPDLPEASDVRYAEAFRAAIGARNSASDMKTIQAAHDATHDTHDHTVALGATCSGGMKSAAAKPCGCGGNAVEESYMTKEQRATAIKTLTETKDSGFTATDATWLEHVPGERLEALELQAKSGIKAAASKMDAEKVISDKASADQALAAHATMLKNEADKKNMKTAAELEDEYLKGAPESIRTLVEDKKRQDAEQKTALVTSIKAATSVYTEAELNEKNVPELTKIAILAKLDVPDYSGRGVVAQRAAAGAKKDDYAPVDAYAEGIKAHKTAQDIH